VVPVTVEDLAANELLASGPTPWERAVETLAARKNEIEGLGVASDERIEACILYVRDAAEVLFLRSFSGREDHPALLLDHLRSRGLTRLRLSKVHPSEIAAEHLQTLGFRPAGRYLQYAATAAGG
jgi:hypothetical protein